jgi:hypothetical protein
MISALAIVVMVGVVMERLKVQIVKIFMNNVMATLCHLV